MGKKIDGITDSTSGQIESKSTDTGTDTGNRSSETTGSGNGNSGSGSGTGTGTGSGTGSTKKVKVKKSAKVSVLTDLPEVNIPEPQETKPKRTYTKRAKKEEPTSFDTKQISAFIVAVSSMVASREGMSHWMITDTEAEQIAKPLSNMIAKSEHLKGLGEHADTFALITACMMIFVPRLIITLQTNKVKKGVKKTNGTAVHNGTKSADSDNKVPRKDAVTPSNDVSTIFDSISAIQ